MRTSRIVALYSPVPQSGKSTIAELLVEKHKFVRLRFADALKRIAQFMLVELGLSRVQAFDFIDGARKGIPILTLGGKTGRDLMISLGTDCGRALHQDIWVNALATQIHKAALRRIIIDDLRFPNEYQMLWNQHALMVRVERIGWSSGAACEGQLEKRHFHRRVEFHEGDFAAIENFADSLV